MTEKRFWILNTLTKYSGIKDKDKLLTFDEVVDLLNELHDENEELKQFKEKVFVLLDEKIKHYEHKPLSAPVEQPMSVNFDVDVDRLARLSELQELKRELKCDVE